MKKIHLYATSILNIVLMAALFNQLTIQSMLLIVPIIICTTVVQVLEHMSYRKELEEYEITIMLVAADFILLRYELNGEKNINPGNIYNTINWLKENRTFVLELLDILKTIRLYKAADKANYELKNGYTIKE